MYKCMKLPCEADIACHQLRAADKFVADVVNPHQVFATAGPQRNGIKGRTRIGPKEGKLEFRRPIVILEEQSHGQFAGNKPGNTALNPQPGIDLEAFAAIRVNQLEGCRPFPFHAPFVRVRIDPAALPNRSSKSITNDKVGMALRSSRTVWA